MESTLKIIKPSKDFEMVPGALIRDHSLLAIGVYCKMLTLSDGWKFSVGGIAKFTCISIDKARKAIIELESAGYLVRKPLHDGKRFAGYIYTLYPIAVPPDERSRAGRHSDDEGPQLELRYEDDGQSEKESNDTTIQGCPKTDIPEKGEPYIHTCKDTHNISVSKETESEAAAETEFSDSLALQSPETSDKVPKITDDDYVQVYNSTCTKLQKVMKSTPDRSKHLRARIFEWEKFGSPLEIFKQICEKSQASVFGTGHNDRNWKISFDWLIANSEHWVKVMEGKYDFVKEEHSASSPASEGMSDEFKERQREEFESVRKLYEEYDKSRKLCTDGL